MSVFETVADLVSQIRDARQADQEYQWVWEGGEGLLAWRVSDDPDLIAVAFRITFDLHTDEQWANHPAVFAHEECEFEEVDGYETACEIALASWALDDGVLDAILAAGVDADYARTAHRAGVTDAWAIIGGWEAGIPVEYLGALS